VGSDRTRPIDRRQAPRSRTMGWAMVVAPNRYIGTFLLENLSASGALLVGDATLAPGDAVQLLLRLPYRSRRLSVRARIIRQATRDQHSVFAVQFTHISEAAKDALQEAVLHDLQTPLPSSVVLVLVAARDTSASLVRDLQDLGCRPVVVSTVLDAMPWLQASDVSVEAVIADADVGGIDGVSFLELVALDYPNVHRILMGSSENPDCHRAVVNGEVHALLPRSWDRASLARALG
jgi:hypothetical protein